MSSLGDLIRNLTKSGLQRIDNLATELNQQETLKDLKLIPAPQVAAPTTIRETPGTPKFGTNLDTGIEG